MKNFVLIGAAGYIAPKHMKAIKDTGNRLLAALDIHDSAGVLDNYFPEADFFTEFERFDRHCEKLKRNGTTIDYVVVCSPNYLHDAHIRFGLRIGADVICEKPVVLNPWNVDALQEMEAETGRQVAALAQLRYHSTIQQLAKRLKENQSGNRYKVKLEYTTARGNWYHYSWKGDPNKSGGIVANIGFHFFDMLLWLFGPLQESTVIEYDKSNAAGELKLARADVSWNLSIDASRLPAGWKEKDKKTFRMLELDGEVMDFTEGFDALHTEAYHQILMGNIISLEEMKPVTGLLSQIRVQAIHCSGSKEETT